MANKISPKQLFIGAFTVVFAIYFIIGFQPAEAAIDYPITATLEIPKINLHSDVTALTLTNNRLDTPNFIVGSFQRGNKTLLIGHSSTIFQNLHNISINDQIFYNEKTYRVKSKILMSKSAINMTELLLNSENSPDTLILMTCAGTNFNGNDFSHRLIVQAEQANE